jgi:glucose-1-phosphate adenylyltransferase
MNNIIGIINNTKEVSQLKDIIKNRSLGAVPYGGRYRMIDFVLSNMVNSGIENIGVLVQNNYRSLINYMRSPKEWDLDRKKDGLFMLAPDGDKNSYTISKGDLETIYNNLEFINSSKQEYVLITGVNIICNINYEEVLKCHEKMGNDITLVYKETEEGEEDCIGCATIDTDSNGRVVDMHVGTSKKRFNKMCMGMVLMRKSLLLDITNRCVSRGKYDFIKDGIIGSIKKLKIYGYEFNGYVANISTVNNYYKHSMELLDIDVSNELFASTDPIYAKARDQAPARYLSDSKVRNSLISNGCLIAGEIEGSILFRSVKVNKGAIVKNCIIMTSCEIGENVILENVILDKYVTVSSGKHIIGSSDYPIVIEKKAQI